MIDLDHIERTAARRYYAGIADLSARFSTVEWLELADLFTHL